MRRQSPESKIGGRRRSIGGGAAAGCPPRTLTGRDRASSSNRAPCPAFARSRPVALAAVVVQRARRPSACRCCSSIEGATSAALVIVLLPDAFWPSTSVRLRRVCLPSLSRCVHGRQRTSQPSGGFHSLRHSLGSCAAPTGPRNPPPRAKLRGLTVSPSAVSKTVSGGFPPTRVRIPPPPSTEPDSP